MQYRTFGSTGLKLSALGFGGMRFPTDADGQVDFDQSAALMQRAFDLGVNVVDSHPGYCGGKSEPAIGHAIRGRREGLILSTKFPTSGDCSASTLRAKLSRFRAPRTNCSPTPGAYALP